VAATLPTGGAADWSGSATAAATSRGFGLPLTNDAAMKHLAAHGITATALDADVARPATPWKPGHDLRRLQTSALAERAIQPAHVVPLLQRNGATGYNQVMRLLLRDKRPWRVQSVRSTR